VDERDREILSALAGSSELTTAHVARLLGSVATAHEIEGRLSELERRGFVMREELDAATVVPPGEPTPVAVRYWKITVDGTSAVRSADADESTS
jgi:hypothetical protein